MSPEQIKKVAELYSNKSTKGTQGESGSGLGLSLVYDLVQRTKGTIELKSEIGNGTEVILKYNAG